MGVLALAPESIAATYYVNNEATGASDSNPGTESQPWRTLSKASSTVQPGDTVIVRPGTYNERVNFYGGNLNSATVPTTFVADPPRQAQTWGFDTLRAPHLRIVGFDITVPQTLLSSDWTARYAIFVRSSGVEIRDNGIHDVPGAGIHAYWVDPWPSDVVVRDNYLTRVNQGIVVHGYNWLVENNEVTRLVVFNMDCDYMRFFGRNITIRRNYLHGARLADIGNSHVDGFQTFPNNGWFAEDVLVDSNYVESFHQGAMLGVGDWQNHTGYIKNLTFTNNVFVAGEIGGSWGILNAHVENTVIRHNAFLNMQFHGVGVRFGGSGIVQNNIFVNCGHENYYVEDGSTMVGGYNVVDHIRDNALYTNPNDIVADPQLVNTASLLGADGQPFTTDDGYRLTSTSPAIDAANNAYPAKDIFGNPRPNGSGADVGPHEFGASSPTDPPTEPPADAEPATYYVNNQAAGASDNNPGTEASPWKTLAKASATVKPGDTVIVRPGVYDERVKFTGDNLASATVPTHFIADPPREALTRGFDTNQAPHLTITGFEVSVSSTVVSSDPTARYAMYVRSDGVQLVNNYIHDSVGVGIQGSWSAPWPSDVVVRNNTIVRVSQGISIYGFNWLVEENEIRQLVRYDMDCDYMRFFGRNITIRRNHLHGTRETDLAGTPVDAFQTFPNNGWFAEDVTIDSNICQSFHRGAMVGSGDYATQTGYVRNVTLTNNVFAGGDIAASWGVQCVGTENLAVSNNLFLNTALDGTGVGVRAGSSATVQNNIFYNAGENYWSDGGATMTGGYNMLNRVPASPRYTNGNDLVTDPLLVNASNLAGPDGRVLTTDDGYLLQSTSPAIDRAGGILIATDVLGRTRPYAKGTDIGPHESRDVDKKANGKRKNFKNLDSGPKDGRLDTTEAQFETETEFATVDTSGDGYLTMDELIDASLGLPSGRAQTVWVSFAHTGPETGDIDTPFNTLEEGLAFVAPGGALRIAGDAGGTYTGALALQKPVTMQMANTTARIGVTTVSSAEAYTLTSNSVEESRSETSGDADGSTLLASAADDGTSDDTFVTRSGTGGTSGAADEDGSEVAEVVEEPVFEPVLPSRMLLDMTRAVTGAEPVSIRLVSTEPIDPASLWAEVPSRLRGAVRVDWLTHDPDRRDVWVRVTPTSDWVDLLGPSGGDRLTVAAGDDIQSQQFEFAVVSSADSRISAAPSPLEGGVGDVYEIEPRNVFDEPVGIAIPLPSDTTAGDLELMYYDFTHAQWVSAHSVIGFVSEWAVLDGELVAAVNHGGTVQLRRRP